MRIANAKSSGITVHVANSGIDGEGEMTFAVGLGEG
jgi:hypothetical protein